MKNYYIEEVRLRQEEENHDEIQDNSSATKISELSKNGATNFEDSYFPSESFDSNEEAQKVDFEKATSRKGMYEKACGLCDLVISNKQMNRYCF